MEITESYRGIVIVVPTRNRASLAINAIRSALDQPYHNFRVMVSDNSTSTENSRTLSQFCEQLEDSRLRYVRPPEPLSMSKHWDWAIRKALGSYKANHFMYLTDRMILRPGELKKIAELVKTTPDKIVSYNHDHLIDYEKPIRLEQARWTGRVFEVDSSRLLFLSSQCIYYACLPRMLNCVVPRSLLEAVRYRFGSVFSSVSPDFNLCYRSLDLVESIMYYDKSPLIHYALDQSNGMSTQRGITSKDHVDFIANLEPNGRQMYYASPIPEAKTMFNAIVHEYCVVKQETQSPKFPDLNKRKLLLCMTAEVAKFEDPRLKAEMQAVLASYSRPTDLMFALKEAMFALKEAILLGVRSPRYFVQRVTDKALSSFKDVSIKLPRLFLLPPLVLHSVKDNEPTFDTVSEAITYAVKFPRKRSSGTEHVRQLIKASSANLPIPTWSAGVRGVFLLEFRRMR